MSYSIPTHRIEVFGQKVVTRTPRRYIVIVVRPEAREVDGQVYVAFARVEKRTDNHATARSAQRRIGYGFQGTRAVIFDTVTGAFVRS
jgi:hypothetical protein